MSLIVLKGHPDAGLPRGTEYLVVSIESRKHVMVAAGTCSGQLPLDLDPGRYRAVFTKTDPNDPKRILMRHYDEFFVDVTESEFNVLKGLKPKFAKSMQTSDGPRWACKIGGCDFSGMSEYAMVSHEAKHQGFDLSKEGDRARYLVDRDPMVKSAANVQEPEAKGKITFVPPLQRKVSTKAVDLTKTLT